MFLFLFGKNMAINYFDLFVIIVFAFFFIKGAFSGFFEEVSGIVAIVLSVVLLRMYGQSVAGFIGNYSESSLNYPFAIVIIVVGSFLVVSLIVKVLSKIMQITFTGWINRLLGAVFGLVKAVFLTGIVAFVLSWFLRDDPLVSNSATIPYLLDIMGKITNYVFGNYEIMGMKIWK